ncbi:MAG: hypothetical protein RL637_1411 [Pseudomonadota bacterium]|jgi:YggT family protein
MNPNYITVPLMFLIHSLFSLYILAVMLRFLFQSLRVNFRNPIASVIVSITHPPLKWLRRWIPAIGKWDTSAIVLALLLQMAAEISILLLQDVKTSIFTLIVRAISELVILSLNIFIFAIFARAILSWFNPNEYHPAYQLLIQITEPMINRCRRFIPNIQGLDFSPLAILLLLESVKLFTQPVLERFSYLLG